MEKLGMLIWRYHRLLRAEAAEVAAAAWDAREDTSESDAIREHLFPAPWGLVANAILQKDDEALLRGYGSLRQLRETIKKEGLNWERDRNTIAHLFGTESAERDLFSKEKEETPPKPRGDLAQKYQQFSQAKNQGDVPGSSSSAEKEKAVILTMIDESLESLRLLVERWAFRTDAKKKLRAQTALVPREAVADRL